ncbi:MAG: hypothetical protein KAI24_05985, partial [Planctomycetes bacterium]|nr:hypothetical protein [Planctomycetota bacterium]
ATSAGADSWPAQIARQRLVRIAQARAQFDQALALARQNLEAAERAFEAGGWHRAVRTIDLADAERAAGARQLSTEQVVAAADALAAKFGEAHHRTRRAREVVAGLLGGKSR